jgi:hypothetical protein
MPEILPTDYADFLASLTEQEKGLLDLARTMLGTSFFVQWTHLYRDWKTKQKG